MLSSLSSLYDTVRSYSPLAGKPGAKRQRNDDKEDVIITDVLQQTPPAKRVRNSTVETEAGTNSKSSIKGISEFVTKKFKSWSDKYIWWYVVKGKAPKNSERLTSAGTDSEGKEMAEERFNRPVDVLHGCKNNVSTNNWLYERGSTLKRKPIGDRWLESPSVFTCTSTPARNTYTVTKPEKLTASTCTWYSSTRKESCSRKPYDASRYMDSTDMSPVSTQPLIEKVGFTIGRYTQDTSQFGKAPWRSQTKQSRQASTKKSVKRHYRIISTAETVVRLKERERYRELVSQYTGTRIDISSDTTTENLNATRVSMIQAPLEVKTDFLTKSQSCTRVVDGSLLSPRSSLLPPSLPFNVSPTPPQPPVVLRVMPSPSKYIDKPTQPASNVNLYSRPGISEVPYQCSAVKSSPKLSSNATFCNPFDEGWTKRWRDLLSEESLLKERDISKEQRKLDALKQKRQEDSRAVVEKVRQRRRREELGLEELDYTEDEEEEDDEEEEAEGAFVSLTDEMEREIDAALAPGSPDDPVVEGFRVVIKRSDMATLSNLNWLNDEIINFYFTLIVERSKEQGLPKVHAFNSFFYPKLVKSGYASLRRWTKKVNIFAMDLVLVPVHLGMHWCLAVIDMTKKCISYYDSLKGSNRQCLLALRSYLNEESLDKKKVAFDMTGWTTSTPNDIPEQLNGCDCGVFACKYAEYLSRRTKFDFDQRHMPYFRRRMVYEILSKKLL